MMFPDRWKEAIKSFMPHCAALIALRRYQLQFIAGHNVCGNDIEAEFDSAGRQVMNQRKNCQYAIKALYRYWLIICFMKELSRRK